jgi:hypothetical protein
MVERPAVSAKGGTRVKKVILIVVVAALVLAIVPLALAGGSAGGMKHGKTKFNLVGVVRAPAADGTITIYVKAGTKSVRSIRHQEYSMTIDGAKIVWIGKHGKRQTLDPSEISVGAKVKARGTVMWSSDDPPVLTVTIKNLKVRQMAKPEVAPPPTDEPATPPAE